MSRKLCIGFVSIEDASDIRMWSGTPFHILSELRKQDVEVELFSPLDRRLKYALAPAMLLARTRGQSFMLDRTSLLLRSYARQIEQWLQRRHVDVVFATGSIAITCLRCEQPVVFWTDSVFHAMYDYYGGIFANLSATSIKQGKRQEEMALARCDAAVYSSHWAAKTAAALTDPKKIHVLPFGSSLPVASTVEEVARRARGKRDARKDSCELLFVGVDWERKGGDIAVETAKILNESGLKTRLRVVGSQPSSTPPDFVEVLGFIDKSTEEGVRRLTGLFEEADFFILPTKAEASAIVFCEANSFGLPILTYDTGGSGDYVKNGVNGALLPVEASAGEFATRVREMLADSTRYEALSRAAFVEYRDRLNWPASVAGLVELCRSLTHRSERRGVDGFSTMKRYARD